MKKILFLLLVSFGTCQAQPYIFYLHGRIVELQGANAVETTNGYGPYKYNDILDSLRCGGNTVISEVRPKNTEIVPYAEKIVTQIRELLAKNVSPSQITVIGASKGSGIAMHVSNLLKNEKVNFVFMAACTEDLADTGLQFYGNVLSIYEASDFAGTCEGIKIKSTGITNYKEIRLNTGLKHGFIFRPIPEWLNPARKWASGDYK